MHCVQVPIVLQHHIPEQILSSRVQLPQLFLAEFHKHIIECQWFLKDKVPFKPEATSKDIATEGMNLVRTE